MMLLDVIVSARLPQTRAGEKTKNTIYIIKKAYVSS
jgi:hypothetical protein